MKADVTRVRGNGNESKRERQGDGQTGRVESVDHRESNTGSLGPGAVGGSDRHVGLDVGAAAIENP